MGGLPLVPDAGGLVGMEVGIGKIFLGNDGCGNSDGHDVWNLQGADLGCSSGDLMGNSYATEVNVDHISVSDIFNDMDKLCEELVNEKTADICEKPEEVFAGPVAVPVSGEATAVALLSIHDRAEQVDGTETSSGEQASEVVQPTEDLIRKEACDGLQHNSEGLNTTTQRAMELEELRRLRVATEQIQQKLSWADTGDGDVPERPAAPPKRGKAKGHGHPVAATAEAHSDAQSASDSSSSGASGNSVDAGASHPAHSRKSGVGERKSGPLPQAIAPSHPWPFGFRKRFRAGYAHLNWCLRQLATGGIDQALVKEVNILDKSVSGLYCGDSAGYEELEGHVELLKRRVGIRVFCGKTGKLLGPV